MKDRQIEVAEALAAVGLPAHATVAELITHHRANAGLATAFTMLNEQLKDEAKQLKRKTEETVGKAEVVTLCGSSKFKEDFIAEGMRLSLEGKLIISLGLFGHVDFPDYNWATDETNLKKTLDRVHLQKIDLSDSIHVVNPTGYYGESTAREIAYARSRGIPVTFMVEISDIETHTEERDGQ
jgi:hypothetical protein